MSAANLLESALFQRNSTIETKGDALPITKTAKTMFLATYFALLGCDLLASKLDQFLNEPVRVLKRNDYVVIPPIGLTELTLEVYWHLGDDLPKEYLLDPNLNVVLMKDERSVGVVYFDNINFKDKITFESENPSTKVKKADETIKIDLPAMDLEEGVNEVLVNLCVNGKDVQSLDIAQNAEFKIKAKDSKGELKELAQFNLAYMDYAGAKAVHAISLKKLFSGVWGILAVGNRYKFPSARMQVNAITIKDFISKRK